MSTLLALFFAANAAPATLTIAAAADLTNLESPLAAAFEKMNPSDQIRWVTAASAILSQQIENGAPYDIFLSANASFVDQLAAKRKIEPNSVVSYASGRLGILWRDGKPHSLNELKENWVRSVALPNPKLAPYGVAAEQALRHAGIWESVRQKIVYGENVRQTLQLFESGNTDAVLTSDSLLQGKSAQSIPAGWHDLIIQKGGIVAGSPNAASAEQFLQFLTGAAQPIFARFGFAAVTPAVKP
ncbi:MAG TPA: molybdate ABC transporter substrate-binding protein [Bryobacteraceae bacterium]|nr:molybdate ABC transporter substrate-binding protein [Bryobacteraceae bacterium]